MLNLVFLTEKIDESGILQQSEETYVIPRYFFVTFINDYSMINDKVVIECCTKEDSELIINAVSKVFLTEDESQIDYKDDYSMCEKIFDQLFTKEPEMFGKCIQLLKEIRANTLRSKLMEISKKRLGNLKMHQIQAQIYLVMKDVLATGETGPRNEGTVFYNSKDKSESIKKQEKRKRKQQRDRCEQAK